MTGYQRMVLDSLLRLVARGTPSEKDPVLFLIDKCARIGHMQALEDAATLLRGAGVRVWLFFQSIDRVNKYFGDRAGTVLDDLGIQQRNCRSGSATR